MAQVSLNKTFNEVKNTKSITSSTTLKNTDSGQPLLINVSAQVANVTITLPAVEAGLHFVAVHVAVAGEDCSVLFDAGSGVVIAGNATMLQAAGAGGNKVAALSNQTVGFGDESEIGSVLEIICDGSNWLLLRAESQVALVTS